MTKKLLFVLSIVLVAVSLTACAGAPPVPMSLLTLDSEKALPAAEEYEKSLDGLISYMRDSQVIAGDGMDMSYGFIGATGGKKFNFSFVEAGVACELYEFDTETPDDTAGEVIAMVREKGFFEALDKEVKAVLSDNEQFMMIYVCNKEGDEYKALTDRADKAFATFE